MRRFAIVTLALIGAMTVSTHVARAAETQVRVTLDVDPTQVPGHACLLVDTIPLCDEDENDPSCYVNLRAVGVSTRGEAVGVSVEPAASGWSTDVKSKSSVLTESLDLLKPGTGACASTAGAAGSPCAPILDVELPYDEYLLCARSTGAGTTDRVAVLKLDVPAQRVTRLALDATGLTIHLRGTTPEPNGTKLRVIGGSFVSGLDGDIGVQTILTKQVFVTTLALSSRCEPRTIVLPPTGARFDGDTARKLRIREIGKKQPILACSPTVEGGAVMVQVPRTQEGTAKTLVVGSTRQPRDWEARAGWTSSLPPLVTSAGWTRFQIDVKRSCELPSLEYARSRTDIKPLERTCPAVEIDGFACSALRVGFTTTCRYDCRADQSEPVVELGSVALTYADLEWSQKLAAAFSTITARPASEARRVYLKVPGPDIYETVDLRGSRGFRQTLGRKSEDSYEWLAMPGFRCGETLTYQYHGRFGQQALTIRLQDGGLGELAPPDKVFRASIVPYVGFGAIRGELGLEAYYAAVGARIARPIARVGDTTTPNARFPWRRPRSLLQVVTWAVTQSMTAAKYAVSELPKRLEKSYFTLEGALELQGTFRPYQAVSAPGEAKIGYAAFERQVLWLGFRLNWPRSGLLGGVGLRFGGGRGLAILHRDERFTVRNDFVFLSHVSASWQLAPRVVLEGFVGTVWDEDLRRFGTDLHGDPFTLESSGWRFTYGASLRFGSL